MSRWLAILLISLLPSVGCGGGRTPTYPASGKVAFADGKPLQGGTVEFQSISPPNTGETRVSARGNIQPDGTFKLSTFRQDDGAIAGDHRALITQPIPPGRINPYKPVPLVINEKFQRYDTSGLTFTVTSDGPNEFAITVTPPGK